VWNELVLPKFGSKPQKTRFEPEPNWRFRFRFRPGLKPDQTGSSGSGSALILNQTSGSVSGSAKKVPNQTKLDFGNTRMNG